MVTIVLGLAVAVGPQVVGWDGHGHGAGRAARVSAPAVCQTCGVDGRATLPWIAQMQTAPRWQARDNAAHALRKFSWREHPEVVLALCDALLNDPKDDVREEAAESLREMAPCVPAAHEALQLAARNDPDDDVREEAREALSKLRRRPCLAACTACAPAAVTVIPGPGPEPMLQGDPIPPAWVPLLAPGEVVTPAPTEVVPPVPVDPNPLPGLEPIPAEPISVRPVLSQPR